MAASDHPKNRKLISWRVVALLVAAAAAVVWKTTDNFAPSDSDNGGQPDQTTLAMPVPALFSEWESLPESTSTTTNAAPGSSAPAGYNQLFATPEGYAYVPPLDESPPAPLADPRGSPSPIAPSVADATSPVPSFPAERRVWTNYSGKVMVASVEWCDFSTGSLILRDDTGVLRPCEIKHLSAADQAYVLQFSDEK